MKENVSSINTKAFHSISNNEWKQILQNRNSPSNGTNMYSVLFPGYYGLNRKCQPKALVFTAWPKVSLSGSRAYLAEAGL